MQDDVDGLDESRFWLIVLMAAFTERPRSGLSQTSSMVTISSINTSLGSKPLRTMKKVHTFAKRDQAIKRDPNSVTVMRGWLYKQDSSGLKLWKRRWFVLSDFCLFYYRDSREERILGSIPMPSYIITAADPQDRKTRKFTFKAEHSGMRTYYFSADTQEDMNGWIRALTHSARVEPEFSSITSMKAAKRVPQEQRYSSFEDFTKSGLLQDRENAQSAESLEIAKLSEPRRQMGSRSEMMERKLEVVRQDLLAPTNSHRDDPCLTISLEQLTPPPHNGTVPPSTPTSGVQNSAFRFEGGPKPGDEYVDPQRSSLCNVEQWVRSQKEQLPEEQEDEELLELFIEVTSSSFTEFPSRPPPSPRPCPNTLLSAGKRLSLSSSVYGQNTLDPVKYTLDPVKYTLDPVKYTLDPVKYTLDTVKMAENEVDVLLTRLCGQDRLLLGLVNEATQLKAEKDKLEGVWEATHCQMMDFKRHPNIVEQLTFQQRILQEDLIQIRARLCDLSMEIEQSWNEYEFLENELQTFRSSRELLIRCGSPQERGEAQRDVWMIEDVILGLSSNRKNFQEAIGSTQQPEHLSELDSLQTPFGLSPQPCSNSRQSLFHEQAAEDVPCRPPLPQVLHRNHSETVSPANQSEQKHPQGERNGDAQDSPQTSSNYKGQRLLPAEGIRRKGKMSAEEQLERMKRHREAHRQDKPKTSILPQRGVTVSPVMRGALTGASQLNSTTLVTNRPVTNHPTGAHLTASVIPPRSRPGITPTVPTKPASAPEPPCTRNITASSKLVAKLSGPPVRVESQTHEHSRTVRKEYEASKGVITTRYIDADPETALSSEQLQEKQRTVEKIKTMIAKTSPGVAESWSPACRSMHPGERERERIVNLSYTLATEAAQRRRVLTAKALAEFQEKEEVIDNQTLQSKGSRSKPQENGLVFNFGPGRETTNPNSEYPQESANRGAGQNSPGGKTNQYSTKESIPSNQRSTLEIEAANLRLGEQKRSTYLDLSQEMEGMNESSQRRLLRDIRPIVMEGSTNVSLNLE
ncbi:pleckstrin homology domain-containing family A member 7-like [Scyliorhinus canicula]|uniref:pleckstrin homology domain-containing family A member 7-like n=1 Tax=Scyliorhinus canicula TaxID=7830 RepID=UPI0018F3B867|nr:pleckstrin homology domain-containing family A member 7-like [Scyliorhinus canicula]